MELEAAVDAGVDAVAWIEPPIHLAADLAGTSHRVRIGGRDAELTLPLEGARIIDGQAAEPIRRRASFPPPPLSVATAAGPTIARMALGAPPDILALDTVRLRFSDAAMQEDLIERNGPRALSVAFGDWLATVRDWLAGWTGTLRDSPNLSPTPAIRAVLTGHPEISARTAGGRRTLVVTPVRGATGWALEAAFHAASTGRSLPLQQTLYTSAVVHNARDEYREAVIDSCSAAEVALSEVLSTRMLAAGHRQTEVSKMLNGVRGVVDLYRTVAAGSSPLGVSVGAVMSLLAQPRNDAVHGGSQLDLAVAKRAIETARALVDLTPLPTPDEILGRRGPSQLWVEPRAAGEPTVIDPPS